MARSRRAAVRACRRSRLGRPSTLALAGFPDPLPNGREVWLTTRWYLGRAVAVGAGRLRGVRPPGAADDIAVRAGGGRPDAARPSGSSAQKLHVDDGGDLRHPLIAVSPRLSLWRAPTDNDRIGGIAATWSALGLDRLERRLLSLDRAADGRVTTVDEVTTGCGAVIRHERSVTDVGRAISGSTRLSPCRTSSSMSRGSASSSRSCLDFETVDWFGRGPHESYPDRKRGALIGRWRSTVREQTVRTSARRRTVVTLTSAGSNWRTTPGRPCGSASIARCRSRRRTTAPRRSRRRRIMRSW